jgi:hypothetical protein
MYAARVSKGKKVGRKDGRRLRCKVYTGTHRYYDATVEVAEVNKAEEH